MDKIYCVVESGLDGRVRNTEHFASKNKARDRIEERKHMAMGTITWDIELIKLPKEVSKFNNSWIGLFDEVGKLKRENKGLREKLAQIKSIV